MTIHYAAIYIRLSLEDDDISYGKLESESITNQRNLLLDYIQNSPELCHAEVVEFCDDEYSGKNFDRPGVKKLLEAARSGAVQCILVKDLSRFGRDYITVGNYVSRVFPFLGVRFIAVNDHIDSIDTAFKAIIYDMYSRDISKKVRSAKYQLAKQGVYINPVAPYGYQKHPGDKHRLIPDPDTADIVRRIFTLAAGGTSTADIARMLNEECVPTPSQVKAGTPSGHANWAENNWRRQTVHWILRNRQYMGSTVFGKRVRKQIGVRRQTKAALRDWIVVDGCHEPLISKELFQAAQTQLGGEYKQTSGYVKSNHPLNRKVYCGVCGYAIVRRGKENPYYRCDTPETVPGLNCFREKIYMDDIVEAVTEAIRLQASHAVELRHLAEERREYQENQLRTLQKSLRNLLAFQERFAGHCEKLYEDFFGGLLSKEDYMKQKAVLLEQRENAHKREAELRQHIMELNMANSKYVEKYICYPDLDTLTAEISSELLDRVTIWPDGRLEITLNYLDESPFILDDKGVYCNGSKESVDLLPGGVSG